MQFEILIIIIFFILACVQRLNFNADIETDCAGAQETQLLSYVRLELRVTRK